MGTWGTGISSNDTYADVYGEFFDFYNDGHEVSKISKQLELQAIKNSEDSHDFWFALAKAQWECKQLDPEVFAIVREIIESGADIELWRQCEASEKDIRKRNAVLERFLDLLQSERPKAKARKRKIIRQPAFSKGDCIAFKLDNGNFGGAVVLEAVSDSEYGLNLIATTRINQPQKPTVPDIENAEILLKNFANWHDDECICWKYKENYKNDKELFEVLGRTKIVKDFRPNTLEGFKYCFGGGWKQGIIDEANLQFESEKLNPKPSKVLTMKKLTRKWSLKFW
jgi:hypothetical protein